MASMYYLSAAHPFAVPCIKFPPAEVCLQDADPGHPGSMLLGVLYVFPLAFLLPFKYTPSLDFSLFFRPTLSFLCSFRFDCWTLVYVSSYVFGSFLYFRCFCLRFLFLFMACFEPCLNWFKISWHRPGRASFWQAQPHRTVKAGRQGWAHNFVTHN